MGESYPQHKCKGITDSLIDRQIFGIENLALKCGVLNPPKISKRDFQ